MNLTIKEKLFGITDLNSFFKRNEDISCEEFVKLYHSRYHSREDKENFLYKATRYDFFQGSGSHHQESDDITRFICEESMRLNYWGSIGFNISENKNVPFDVVEKFEHASLKNYCERHECIEADKLLVKLNIEQAIEKERKTKERKKLIDANLVLTKDQIKKTEQLLTSKIVNHGTYDMIPDIDEEGQLCYLQFNYNKASLGISDTGVCLIKYLSHNTYVCDMNDGLDLFLYVLEQLDSNKDLIC